MGFTSTTFEEGYTMSESSVPARSGGDYERLISFFEEPGAGGDDRGRGADGDHRVSRLHVRGAVSVRCRSGLPSTTCGSRTSTARSNTRRWRRRKARAWTWGRARKPGHRAETVVADGKAAYQWIAYNELQKPGEAPKSSSFIDMLISGARADETPKPFRVAQGLEVVCQAIDGKNVLRVVKEGGKCFKEVFSPIKGAVEKRDEVACSTPCG